MFRQLALNRDSAKWRHRRLSGDRIAIVRKSELWQNSRDATHIRFTNKRISIIRFLAHRERTAVLKWRYRLLCGSLFLLPAIGLLALATDPHAKFVTIIPLFVLAAIWGVLIWGAPWWSARSQYLQQPGAQGPRTMTLDGSGILSTCDRVLVGNRQLLSPNCCKPWLVPLHRKNAS
jgi:hypothetical protein